MVPPYSDKVSRARPYRDWETLRIFEVGTILEKVVVGWLREDGWEVYHNEGSQEAEWEITVEVKGGSGGLGM